MESQKPQKKKRKPIQKATISIADLNKLIDEANIPVAVVERGAGMPLHTLQKILKQIPEGPMGYVRGLPKKYELKILKTIRNFKAEKEEEKQQVKEILIENKIEVPIIVPEEAQPDIEGKKEWMNVLVNAKAEYNRLHPTE